MTHRDRVWPCADAYQEAVRVPRRCLRDPRLHALRVESRFFLGAWRPQPRAGNFGAVYKFIGPGPALALKVFYKDDPDRHRRYRLIHAHLAAGAPSPHLIAFRYDAEGVLVAGRWYPALVMDWAEGQPLDAYLRERQGRVANGALCQAWARLVLDLQARGIAHGDLQHGNVLVTPAGGLRLVDYDGLFVPALRTFGLAAAEVGVAAYQHPLRARQPRYFDERLDDFAALVILLTLAAVDTDRWRRFQRDDNQLLLGKDDLTRPERSPLLGELAQSADAPLRRLAALLRAAAQGPLEAIPSFRRVAVDPEVAVALSPTWRPAATKTITFHAPSALRPWWQTALRLSSERRGVSPPVK